MVQLWRSSWAEVLLFLDCDVEIRGPIDTTNAIGSVNVTCSPGRYCGSSDLIPVFGVVGTAGGSVGTAPVGCRSRPGVVGCYSQ